MIGPCRRALFALLAVLVLAGCTSRVAGSPSAGDGVAVQRVDPSFVQGTDHGPIDGLAATTVSDVQDFWRQTFPAALHQPWRDIRGFYSVDTDARSGRAAPCTGKPSELSGNALYCPEVDGVAWDRTALLPVLADHFNEAGVVLVLAHEIGHAVHNRAGITPAKVRADPQRYPTILTEAMADCYSGAVVRWVVDGHAPHLRITSSQLDTALGAIVTFRDPVGTGQNDNAAHGNAFDRVGSFQDGYQRGAGFCAAMTTSNRQFTLAGYTSLDDRGRGGNIGYQQMLSAAATDLTGYFGGLLTQRGRQWQPPRTTSGSGEPRCAGPQGPIAFCPRDGTIAVDTTGRGPRIHQDIGDYATGTLLASRFGLAALAGLGRPTQGGEAGTEAVCLAGAYTGTILARHQGFGLSPGDLDEAVQVLLGYDYAARDTAGATGVHSGFDRVARFRAGVERGPTACGLG